MDLRLKGIEMAANHVVEHSGLERNEIQVAGTRCQPSQTQGRSRRVLCKGSGQMALVGKAGFRSDIGNGPVRIP